LLKSFGQMRRRLGADETPLATPDDAVLIAAQLVSSAGTDAQLARDLELWLSEAQAALATATVVTNSVSGVVIGSSVVQTGPPSSTASKSWR
jgi:TRAP-type C4-dicarboxylate transport system permease large subunit